MKIYLKLLLVFCCFGGLLKAGEYESVLLPGCHQVGHEDYLQVVDSDDYAFVFRKENEFFSINWEGDVEFVSAFPFEYHELSLKGVAAQGSSLVLTGNYSEADDDYFQPWVFQKDSFEKLCCGDYLFTKSYSVNSEGTVLGLGFIDASVQLISWNNGELSLVSDKIIPGFHITPGWITETGRMVSNGSTWTTSPRLSLSNYILNENALILDENYNAGFAVNDLVAVHIVFDRFPMVGILGLGIFNFSTCSFTNLEVDLLSDFKFLSEQHIAMNVHGDVVGAQFRTHSMEREIISIWKRTTDESWSPPRALPLFNMNVADDSGLYISLVCLNIHRDGRILVISTKDSILFTPSENI